jgi:hypothetical protein
MNLEVFLRDEKAARRVFRPEGLAAARMSNGNDESGAWRETSLECSDQL